ncbi:hypothetical protein H7849_09955 [Alloacidobacterium dinghuense]|uniref:DUF4384 domain-containing protein n=1 Tax=Alloacidobacterium dinghuense TaxID=2763107 RepID=A0A7G8BNR7_9BACT|nr:hypothetical protein [Alloacidobacterium dinghuense]QNI34187.1 hypothetical protein H7849_09955 [Alloacidobacterium dinghuense]
MLNVKILATVALLIAIPVPIHAEDGIAWEVHGNWYANQIALRKGDAIAPGAVLTAAASTGASMLILLPDGQRLLFDCHNAPSCTQGFRVPSLIAKPDEDAMDLFAAVRGAMRRPMLIMTTPLPATTMETESVIAIQEDGRIRLKQIFTTLPPGQYRMSLQGEGDAQPSVQSLAWSGPHDETTLPLPHPGMYRLQLYGSLGGERMRIVLLAESASLFPARQKAFTEARADLREWNETFPGWPVHQWLQLFLQSMSQPESAKP